MHAIDLRALAQGASADSEASPVIVEARRVMEICNACRYCEGFCAVFPAMELRRAFSAGDLTYLANLCHSCGECYSACQYAPPHEFGINVPMTLALARNESYVAHAWPAPLAAAFRRNGLVMALSSAVAVGIALLLVLFLQNHLLLFGVQPVLPGAGFYNVVPYAIMAWVSIPVFLFSLLALGVGFSRYWKSLGGTPAELTRPGPLLQALRDAATLRYLGGGAARGCKDAEESLSTGRRGYHHLMAYGFLLCLASTSTATLYDYLLRRPAPYPFFSLPVLLGFVGGIGMVVGTVGLMRIKLMGSHERQTKELLAADAALVILLMLVALTGLLLLCLRATGAMGVTLIIHLGLVLAFFLTMPYSKFVHGLYRGGALLRYATERPGS
jgi:citrate/tricarballylate utilization protein